MVLQRDAKIPISVLTSTGGTATPRLELMCLVNTVNFGLRALAAGPPSVPNSLNLQGKNPQKVTN
jgi:hypothetical protein